MTKSVPAVAALALLLATGAAAAHTPAAQPSPADTGKPATIPFVRFGQIDNWEADPNGNGVYLQDVHRKWYYASLFQPCLNLPFAERIAVKTRGLDSLDNFGTIFVDGQRCDIQKLVESGPPPSRHKAKRAS